MTLSSIANFVCVKIGKTDSSSIAIAKDFVRQRHEMVYDTGLWKDSIIITDFTLQTRDTTDTNPYTSDITSSEYLQTFTLPYAVARPINIVYDSELLSCRDLQSLAQTQPDTLLSVGDPVAFTEMEPQAISKPTSSEPFKMQLKAYTDASDAGKAVYFKGTRNQRPVNESLALTANNHYGSVEFDEVHYASKPVTDGEVQFSNGAATEVIPAEETRYSLCRVRLNLKPQYVDGETVSVIVIGKKRIRPLRNDNDEPMIRGIDNALIAFVEGDMLERGRQFAKAQIKFQEASSLLTVTRDIERGQSAAVSVLQPNTLGDFDRSDFGF